MKLLKWFSCLSLAIMAVVTFSSCSSDDDGVSDSSVPGTYYGKNTQNGRTYSMSVVLKSNQTGDFEYHAPSYSSYASFTWKKDGKKIKLNGKRADTDGETYDFNHTMTPKGDGYEMSGYSNGIILKKQ